MLPTMRRNDYLPEMFNDFFGLDYIPSFVKQTTPKINVKETDKEYCVELAVAGAKKEDFELNLTNDGMLSVKFEHKKEHEEGKKNEKYWRKEFCYSEFERSFTLPDDVNKDAIAAKVENGILEITLPKTEAKPKEENTPIKIA